MSRAAGPGGPSLAGFAAALLCLSVHPARAQPCAPVVVRGCDPWFSAGSLRRALGTEGVRCALVVSCADGRLRIDDDGPSWELSQMPQAVRARVIALLIAETLREPPEDPTPGEPTPGESRASAPPEAAPDPGPLESSAPESSALELPAGPASLLTSPAVIDPDSSHDPDASSEPASPTTAAREERPPFLAPGAVAPSVGAPRRVHPGAVHVSHEAATDPGVAARIGAGAEVRVFLAPITAVAGPALVFAYDAIRVEAAWSFGRANDERLGAASLMLGHIDFGVNLVCGRWVEASLCATALAELGYARADARAVGDAIGVAAERPFVGGSIEVGVWLATEVVAVAVGLRGGFGYGLVAEADRRELAALGGAWIGAHLALELEPGR